MKNTALSFVLTITFLALPAVAASSFSGYKVSTRVKVEGTETPMETTSISYMAGNQMRAEMNNPILGPTVLIQKEPSSPTYMLIPAKKTYYNMEKMPFKPRSKGAKTDAKVPYRDTGKTKKIAGYSCKVRTRKIKGSIEEICVTQGLKELYSKAVGMNALSKQFGGTNPLKELGGYPLEILQYPEGKEDSGVRTSMMVETIEKGKFAANLFEIPAGYTETDPPGLGFGSMADEMEESGGMPGNQKDLQEMIQKMKEGLLNPSK